MCHRSPQLCEDFDENGVQSTSIASRSSQSRPSPLVTHPESYEPPCACRCDNERNHPRANKPMNWPPESPVGRLVGMAISIDSIGNVFSKNAQADRNHHPEHDTAEPCKKWLGRRMSNANEVCRDQCAGQSKRAKNRRPSQHTGERGAPIAARKVNEEGHCGEHEPANKQHQRLMALVRRAMKGLVRSLDGWIFLWHAALRAWNSHVQSGKLVVARPASAVLLFSAGAGNHGPANSQRQQEHQQSHADQGMSKHVKPC